MSHDEHSAEAAFDDFEIIDEEGVSPTTSDEVKPRGDEARSEEGAHRRRRRGRRGRGSSRRSESGPEPRRPEATGEARRAEPTGEPRRAEPDGYSRSRPAPSSGRDRTDRDSHVPAERISGSHDELEDDEFVEVGTETGYTAHAADEDTAVDDHEFIPVDSHEDSHDGGDHNDADHDHGDDEHADADDAGDDESEVVKAPREIPTWQEAIGVIVAANMESRARSPRGSGNQHHRGRSSGGPPRGNRPAPRDRGGSHSGG